jgi:isocitrate dehydrogenase kinase/phosphatase
VSVTTDLPEEIGPEPPGPELLGPAAAGADGEPPPEGDPVERAYAALAGCMDDWSRIDATTRLILAIHDEFYGKLCEYPYQAMRAFETMDPQASIRISEERLGLYSRYIAEHGSRIRAAFPALADLPSVWDQVDRLLSSMIADRYEADIVFSFAHSIRRNIGRELWRPVAYSFPPPSKRRALSMASVYRRIPVHGHIDAELVATALRVPGFTVPFRDLRGDAERIVERINFLLDSDAPDAELPVALDVVEAGFFRDRSAFVVGRWVLSDASYVPFVVALLNSGSGIVVDAVLHRIADVHNLFSSTLANFHVTTRLYYQTCVFLFSLMPRRPLGHHYSTIGFNHVGKVAILNEVTEQLRQSGQKFQRSPGYAGTVALGFTFESCSYHLKVIRDRPTRAYKWGEFPGVEAVLDKYRAIHEINRAGSMLDNVMYYNLRLDRDMFDPALLADICQEAAGSVHVDGQSVFIRSLIVQLKIVPLPVYLETAEESEIRSVIASLGNCIRNNAATNLFNKDLDSRNYGVGRYGRVLLFDYDALESLTEVKIRTNLDREPGEEDVPAWFFEGGVVFLPEEIEYGLQLKNETARRQFRRVNADLMTVDYWRRTQQRLLQGEVPELRMYPDNCKLLPPPAQPERPAGAAPAPDAAAA